MKICWSLSGAFKGIKIPYSFDSPEFKSIIIGKPIYLNNYKVAGCITDISPELDLIYGEVPGGDYDIPVLDSKCLNLCIFKVVKEEK